LAEEVRLAKADLKRPAAKAPVTMRGLWRLVSWGTTAAAFMLIAVLSSRGVVGAQRAAVAMATLKTANPVQPAVPPGFDAQAEIRRLSNSVRELASANDELKARIGMVEHSMDDVTGSIAQQQAKIEALPPAPWPDPGTTAPTTPATIAAVMAPPLPMPMEYGADIGGAASIQALRARWAGIRSAHPQLFEGVTPTVSLSPASPPNRPELRLVVGPLPNADAATHLCAALNRYRLTCQPTIFAGQHLALD
jgi:hypothetical protein